MVFWENDNSKKCTNTILWRCIKNDYVNVNADT